MVVVDDSFTFNCIYSHYMARLYHNSVTLASDETLNTMVNYLADLVYLIRAQNHGIILLMIAASDEDLRVIDRDHHRRASR